MNPQSLEELTIGEIRRALAQGAPEMTVREALAELAESDEIGRRHEQQQARYQAYVETRAQRLAAAEEEAMDEVDREQQRSGRPWPNREERFTARRDAGLGSPGTLRDRRAAASVRGLGRGRISRALQGGNPGRAGGGAAQTLRLGRRLNGSTTYERRNHVEEPDRDAAGQAGAVEPRSAAGRPRALPPRQMTLDLTHA
jgi:hypothetical protein